MKNLDIKNLRVAVVPTSDNEIDQSSSVEEIFACKETILYPIIDYFQAQNNEDLSIHWSFLIDIETEKDWTGANINGIHQDNKKAKIAKIKSIIANLGMTTTSELELESSPCLYSVGTNKSNISDLVEEFTEDYARVITYHNETIISEKDVQYEELPNEIIEEIYEIIVKYEKDCIDNED